MRTPGHPLHDLVAQKARYYVYWGGRDSAKSWGVAEHLVECAAQGQVRILCTREYQNTIRDSVYHLLRQTIDRLGYQSEFHVTATSITSNLGSEFIFRGMQDVDGIKSMEGIDIVWVEEAHRLSDQSWQTLIPTIRKRGSRVIVTFNLVNEEDPTYQRMVLHPPPGAIVHKVNYDQNPFLSDESRGEIEHLRRVNIHAYEHVYLGMPLKFDDSIIFSGKYTIEGFPPELAKQCEMEGQIKLGVDWGFANDPTAMVRCFIHQNRLYIEEEAFGLKIEFAGNMSEDGRGELEQLFDGITGSRHWPIFADSARPETISFMRGKGFNVEPADKWTGCVEDGISYLKSFEKIVIHDRCKNMQQEARLYSYKRQPKTDKILPIVVDANNHGWDAVRYSLNGYIQRSGDLGLWERLGQSQ